MISNYEYIERAHRKETANEDLAPQNFRRINTIMSHAATSDEVIYESILNLKIIRMKKVMAKHGTVILSREQAGEIWGGNV
jgi:hypothetical protein